MSLVQRLLHRAPEWLGLQQQRGLSHSLPGAAAPPAGLQRKKHLRSTANVATARWHAAIDRGHGRALTLLCLHLLQLLSQLVCSLLLRLQPLLLSLPEAWNTCCCFSWGLT